MIIFGRDVREFLIRHKTILIWFIKSDCSGLIFIKNYFFSSDDTAESLPKGAKKTPSAVMVSETQKRDDIKSTYVVCMLPAQLSICVEWVWYLLKDSYVASLVPQHNA